MRNRWPQTLLMLVVLGGYLFSLLGLPGVSVLCYGQSGHLAVETYGTVCTAGVPADVCHEQYICTTTENDKPNCIDILIQTEPASLRSIAGNFDLALLAHMHAILPELPLALPSITISPMRVAHDFILPSIDDTQMALRSVILLV